MKALYRLYNDLVNIIIFLWVSLR